MTNEQQEKLNFVHAVCDMAVMYKLPRLEVDGIVVWTGARSFEKEEEEAERQPDETEEQYRIRMDSVEKKRRERRDQIMYGSGMAQEPVVVTQV